MRNSYGPFHEQLYATETGSAPYSVAVADFNNDTYLDIVVANSGTNNIIILFGNGTGDFPINETYSTGIRSRPYQVTIGDFNNDKVYQILLLQILVLAMYYFYMDMEMEHLAMILSISAMNINLIRLRLAILNGDSLRWTWL